MNTNKYIGKYFYNKKGDKYEILSCVKNDNKNPVYLIKFIDTGYKATIYHSQIKRGDIVDRLKPSVAGVGIIGNSKGLTNTRVYRVWHNMINRCYNPKSTEYCRYGAKNVTVCNRWYYLENFINDIKLLKGYSEELFLSGDLYLDKDYLSDKLGLTNKIYSPDTCQFVSMKENTCLACNIPILVINLETGEKKEYESAADFSAEKHISKSQVYNTISGRQKTCHGYEIKKI